MCGQSGRVDLDHGTSPPSVCLGQLSLGGTARSRPGPKVTRRSGPWPRNDTTEHGRGRWTKGAAHLNGDTERDIVRTTRTTSTATAPDRALDTGSMSRCTSKNGHDAAPASKPSH